MTAHEKNTGFARMGSLLTGASMSLALLASCGGGSSGDGTDGGRTANNIETSGAALLNPSSPILEDGLVFPGDVETADVFSETAVYRVTVRNFGALMIFPRASQTVPTSHSLAVPSTMHQSRSGKSENHRVVVLKTWPKPG